MTLKDVHVLIPRSCKYVTIYGKRNFTNVIKLRILRWEIILDYLVGSSVITRVLIRRRQEGQSQKVHFEVVSSLK